MLQTMKLLGAVALVCALVAPPAYAQDWKQDWERTVAAAKQEGELVISGPPGRLWSQELMRFEQAYPGIKLSVAPSSGRDFWPRFVKEREVGQYLWDLRVGGYDAMSYRLQAQGDMASIRDLLVLPEVVDGGKWYGGLDALFIDNQKRYALGFVAMENTIALYNKKFISDPSIADVRNLIDPKWKGRIAMADPHSGSPANSMAVFYKVFGPDFVRKLVVDQKPVIIRNSRLQLDWLASGRYPIAFGLTTPPIVEYAARGGDISSFERIGGLHVMTPNFGALHVFTKAPHPAATKVFVNWLLTRDVQAHLMKSLKLNSRRKDVPLGAPDLAVDYAKIDEYFNNESEDMLAYKRKTLKLLRQIIK